MSAFAVVDEEAMGRLGAALARALSEDAVVYLNGDLGAGKTTLVRGVLRGLGHTGRVRSPTYTLVEGYEVAGRTLYHLDLYRISDPGELEFLGVRELDTPGQWVFIEWPERGAGALPPADLSVHFAVTEPGRLLTLEALTGRGQALARAWSREAAKLAAPKSEVEL